VDTDKIRLLTREARSSAVQVEDKEAKISLLNYVALNVGCDGECHHKAE
jgi:hypothetical protein